MPEIKDIERFNEILFSLGSEPEILKERNEELEVIPIPKDTLPTDVSELLDSPIDNASSDDFEGDLDDISTVDTDTSGMTPSDELDTSLDIPGIPDTSVDIDDSLGIQPDTDDTDDADYLALLNGLGTDLLTPGEDSIDRSLPDNLSSDTIPPEDDSSDLFLSDDIDAEIIPPDDDMSTDTTPDDISDFSLPENIDTSLAGDLGTDIIQPGDDFSDMSITEDLGDDIIPPDDDLSDLSFSGDSDTDSIPDDMSDFSLSEDLGTEILPPGDDFSDLSLTDDSSTDTIPDDIGDFSLPDDLGTDILPLRDDFGDTSITDGLGDDILPPDDDIDGLSFPDNSDIDTTSDDISDFSLPDDLGADILPPGDDFGDTSLADDIDGLSFPDDSGIDTTPDDIGDFSLPEDLGADIIPPGDDFGDSSISDVLGDDIIPPGDDFGDTSLADDLENDMGDLSLPDDINIETRSPAENLGTDTIKPGGEISTDIDSFEINDEDEFFIDEFSIPDDEEEIDALSDTYAPAEGEGVQNEFSEVLHEVEDISITEEQLQAIQKTLNTLPLNLKIKAEELIGLGQAIGDELRSLLGLLITGGTVQEIATLISQITGEKIVLPKRFEKKTGVAFEKERKSFRYVLRENIVPLLSVFIPSLIILAFLTFAGYSLKTWLDAQDQYKQGLYYIIQEKEFDRGNEEFEQAYKKAKDNSWYFRYAEAFIGEHQYEYAREKYEQLLDMKWNGDKIQYIVNFDKKGLITYAHFESNTIAHYQKAATLLDYLLFRDPYNNKALLEAGDNFLKWAKEDATYYQSASEMYAKFKNKYGETPDIMLRYLRYFIETDNYSKVIELKTLFESLPKIKVDPEIYSQMGGYLLDYNQITDVRDILSRALKVDKTVPDIHYQLARYFQIMKEPREEEKALLNAKEYYATLPPLALNKEKLLRYIDSYNRLGELYYQNNRTGHAETELDNAITLIEDRQKKKVLGPHKYLGKVYYNRGNIFYDYKDFAAALRHYEKAGNNLYGNPEMNFKKGYIYYRGDDYLNALLDFYKAEKGIRNNPNILFSIGNSLYYRGDYFAAQGYYNHLLNILEKRRGKIDYVRPDENPAHKSLFNIITRTYNNLGVTLKKISEISGNQQKEAEALVYLTKSSEHYDTLDRLITNPETMERDKVTKNLAFLNQRHIFYPQVQYELSLYKEIPIDTQTLDIDDLFSTKVGN